MAPTAPLCFTVPTDDICVICLTPSPTSKYAPLQPIAKYLNLDIKQIFNIKSNIINGGDGVNVEVLLCKSCAVLRNAFFDMIKEQEKIQRKLEACVRGLKEVMLSADNNIVKVKGYVKVVTAGGNKNLKGIKESIPEKFRIETLKKCSERVVVKNEAMGWKPPGNFAAKPKKEEKCEEELDEFEAEFLKEQDLAEATAGAALKGEWNLQTREVLSVSSSEDEDEPDPEELMLKYDSLTDQEKNEKFKRRKIQHDPLGSEDMEYQNSDLSGERENMEIEVDMDSFLECSQDSSRSGSTTPIGLRPKSKRRIVDAKPGTYSSKYECELCGKTVVSLKNFELHQRRHAGEKPFECQHCRKTFRDTSNLRSHVLRYHRHFLFAKFKKQEVSIEQFKNGLDQLIHSVLTQAPCEKSSTLQTHGCQLYDRYYTQRYAIEDHVVQRHYDILAMSIRCLQTEMSKLTKEDCLSYMTQLQSEDKTARMCGLCGELFDTSLALNMHVKTHVKVSLIRNCETIPVPGTSSPAPNICNSSMIKLKMKCEPCGRYFEDLKSLNKHKDLTEGTCTPAPGQALFKCEYCPKALNTFHSHRRHLLSLHRYHVFAKYLPPGSKAAEVEAVIKSIFDEMKPRQVAGGWPCFICDKVITQFRKLSGHVMVSHFSDVVMLVKKGLRAKRSGREMSPMFGRKEEDIEVIEIGDFKSRNDEEGCPQILRIVDSNGDDISGDASIDYVDTPEEASGKEFAIELPANGEDEPKFKFEYEVTYK